jgi:site-specific DNA recombinase
LLQLLVHQITIADDRKIESIQLKLNNDVLQELKLGAGDLSTDESSAPFYVLICYKNTFRL